MYQSIPEKPPTQEEPLLSNTKPPTQKRRQPPIFILALINTLVLTIYFFPISFLPANTTLASTSKALEDASWSTLHRHTSLLSVPPIPSSEFLARQKSLSSLLSSNGIDAFITEPSASSQYYTNISSSYSLSERPFLIIISKNGEFSYLAPKFELGRIADLDMVFDEEKGKTVMEWGEEENPFEVLRRGLGAGVERVMVDENVRYRIVSRLQDSGVEVVSMSEEMQSLRAVKSENEIKILKGINAFTLELIRSLQRNIKVGMSQEDIFSAAGNLFQRAGVGKGYWAIVLFGEGAANPHGGSRNQILKEGEFVLIDIGSTLHEYGSDVTRTILPTRGEVSEELMGVWRTVQEAQAKAGERMNVNEMCRVVDGVARKVIEGKGYGDFFTHRLGHGLGLEMHEHPYLNGANEERLRVGEVVTNEPGIYVTTEEATKLGKDVGFGVRLEDPILVTEDGGVPMTGARAKSPYEP